MTRGEWLSLAGLILIQVWVFARTGGFFADLFF